MKVKTLENQSINPTDIKTILVLLILSCISTNVFGQEMDCNTLKEGVYYAEVLKPFHIEWKVTRSGNQQIEEVIKLPDEAKKAGYPTTPQHEIIEWINDCTYLLKYDETKFELSTTQKAINENGGALNRIVKVEGDCHYYISTITINGRETSMEGKLCSE